MTSDGTVLDFQRATSGSCLLLKLCESFLPLRLVHCSCVVKVRRWDNRPVQTGQRVSPCAVALHCLSLARFRLLEKSRAGTLALAGRRGWGVKQAADRKRR